MKILKPILILALMLSIALNLYLAVKLVDAAISLEHRSMGLKYETESSSEELELLSFVLKEHVDREQIISIANHLENKGVIVKKRDGFIEVGRLEIGFNGNDVVKVERF